jgi:urea transporter
VAGEALSGSGELSEKLRLFARAIVTSYAQIVFSRSAWVGALVMVGLLLEPRALALSLVGSVVAAASAWLLGFDRERIGDGIYGYAAVLVGLGVAASFVGWELPLRIVVFAALAAMIVTAAAEATLGGVFALPVLTVPFVAVHYLVLAAAPLARLPVATSSYVPPDWVTFVPAPAAELLRSLGALFFLPRVEVGLVIFLALLVYSRIAAVFASVSFAFVLLLDTYLLSLPAFAVSLPAYGALSVLGFNAMLSSIALGAVWFVPSRSSLVFAMFATVVSALVTVGSMPVLARLGIPALALPFNATVLVLLAAMRVRRRDALPRAVDFALGSPEENLAYDQSRRARFGAELLVPLRLPVLGTWHCTQGVDGAHTHKGAWRHGFDFEILDAEGRAHRGDGTRLEQYLCYRLPVVACAAGTVVRVVDGIRDNRPGELNVAQNWGNVVIVAHELGLYSVTAHLSPGSIKVREGQIVQAGDELGLCGSSGRAPTPHVHLQMQSTGLLGAATRPATFDDVIAEGGDGVNEARNGWIPAEGTKQRSVEASDDAWGFVPWRPEEQLLVEVNGRRERLRSEVDLLGRSSITSPSHHAALLGGKRLASFVFFDLVGSSPALRALFAALPRLPLELDRELSFADRLPLQRIQRGSRRFLYDFVSPFLSVNDVEVRYRARREGPLLVVEGKSAPGARVEVVTRVEIDRKRGLLAAEARIGSDTLELRRVFEDQPSDGQEPAVSEKGAS